MQPNGLEKLRAAAENCDNGQRRALKGIACFFAALLVFSLISRGFAGAAMPTVTLARPYYGSAAAKISAVGSIASAEGQPFAVPEGLTVQQVYLKAGEQVSAGDAIAAFDSREVEMQIALKQAEIEKLKVQTAQLRQGAQADSFAISQAQEQLLRAYKASRRAYDEGQQQIAQAQAALAAAEAELNSLQSAPVVATPESAEYQTQQAGLEAARQQYEQAAAALAAAEKAAEDSSAAALAAAQSVEDSRNSAINSYEKSAEQTQKQNQLDSADANVQAAELLYREYELELLRGLQADGYTAKAPCSGRVTEIRLKAGESSGAVGGLIAKPDAGCVLTATLDAKQAERLTAADRVTVTQGELRQLASISLSPPGGDGAVTLTAELAGDWQPGAAQLTAETEGEAGLCLPLNAVNTDAQGFFVYTVEQRTSLLGLQNVLVRTPVTVLYTGDTAAVISGALDEKSSVAATGSKPLSPGAYVRVGG